MSKNFLIIYTARDGSTAIVNLLSKHEKVIVPLMEGLDPHNFPDGQSDDAYLASLDQIYSEGKYKGPQPEPGDLEMRDFSVVPKSEASVGFKWRFAGDKMRTAEVLLRHKVIVYFLHRRDFEELVSSIHFTDRLNEEKQKNGGMWHPQFEFKRGTAAERSEIKSLLEAERPTIKPLGFLRVMAARARRAWRLKRMADLFSKAGIDVRTIYYEDFSKDNLGFTNKILKEVGLRPMVDKKSAYSKPTSLPAKERLRGLTFWRKSGVLPLVTAFYDRQI